MVSLNVDIPAEPYERIYAAKGKMRQPIRQLVLRWIEAGLTDMGLPPVREKTDKSKPAKK
jgi:hypothetical protein